MFTFNSVSLIAAGNLFDGIVNDKADPNSIISKVLPVVWWFAVILAVIYVAYGGFLYTTSSGDSNKVNEAKSSILNGIIGLIVTLFIGLLFRLVLGWL
jgi:hypothetical protein